MRVKFFSATSLDELEHVVNEWMVEGHDVMTFRYAAAKDDSGALRWSVAVLYEEAS